MTNTTTRSVERLPDGHLLQHTGGERYWIFDNEGTGGFLDLARALTIHEDAVCSIPIVDTGEKVGTISNMATLLMLSARMSWPIHDVAHGLRYKATRTSGTSPAESALYEERFNRLVEDGRLRVETNARGASAVPARYAVLSFCDVDGWSLGYAETLQDVETLAVSCVTATSVPLCYFDLAELDGEEPPIVEGDTIRVEDGATDITVENVDSRGRVYFTDYDGESRRAAQEDVVLVARATPDARLPRRHAVVRIDTTVTFADTTVEAS